MGAVDKLLQISSAPFTEAPADEAFGENTPLMQELARTLYRKNGFFAVEAALRVFPTKTSEMSYGVFEWNSDNFWKSYYGDLTDGCFFFGEDAFGGQFCIAKALSEFCVGFS